MTKPAGLRLRHWVIHHWSLIRPSDFDIRHSLQKSFPAKSYRLPGGITGRSSYAISANCFDCQLRFSYPCIVSDREGATTELHECPGFQRDQGVPFPVTEEVPTDVQRRVGGNAHRRKRHACVGLPWVPRLSWVL